MEDRLDKDNKDKEHGEDQLHQLIKEAGKDARLRRKKTMEKHRKMVEEAVAEGASRWRNPISR